jgi:predicted metal-dependent peptidase
LDKVTENQIKGHGTNVWKKMLNKYARETKEKLTEFRINTPRRARWSMETDLGLYGAEVESPKFRISVGIDTSGSMSSHTLKEILEFVQGLMKMDDELEVQITEYDTQIHKNYVLKRCGEVDSSVLGRGGTDFTAFFRHVFEQQKTKGSGFRPDIVFNFTDGEASPPREEYRFNTKETPLIWVLYQGGTNPCPEYGESVSM